jgi:hypothetical protein
MIDTDPIEPFFATCNHPIEGAAWGLDCVLSGWVAAGSVSRSERRAWLAPVVIAIAGSTWPPGRSLRAIHTVAAKVTRCIFPAALRQRSGFADLGEQLSAAPAFVDHDGARAAAEVVDAAYQVAVERRRAAWDDALRRKMAPHADRAFLVTDAAAVALGHLQHALGPDIVLGERIIHAAQRSWMIVEPADRRRLIDATVCSVRQALEETP